MNKDIRDFFKPKAKKHSRVISSDDEEDVKINKEVKVVDPNSFFSQNTVKHKPRNVTNKLNEKTLKALNEPQKDVSKEINSSAKASKPSTPKASDKVEQDDLKEEGKKPRFNYHKYMASKQAVTITETRPLPVGSPNCLVGQTFVFTGDLCSMTRETAADCVKRYGGRVTGAPSKKTSYVVLGSNPGPAKVAKAESLKLATLNEDEFYHHINSTVPGYVKPDITEGVGQKPSAPYGTSMPTADPSVNSSPNPCVPFIEQSKRQVDDDEFLKETRISKVQNEMEFISVPKPVLSRPNLESLETPKTSHEQSSLYSKPKPTPQQKSIVDKGKSVEKPFSRPDLANMKKSQSLPKPTPHIGKQSITSELWTEKYRPQQMSEVIGNASLIEKLKTWLANWQVNKLAQFPKGELSQFRAALLSGPPGIGKTTSAHLVARISDFEVIEFNASDTRSKKSLQSLVRESTISGSILGMFKKGKKSKKVLIMDEVDGMSSGDRGGSTELLDIIKKTGIPIICICNDRTAPKMKSLANYCLDLKFRRYLLLIRPTAQQLEKRMGVIAAKEGLNLGANAIGELNQSTSGDIRQILNILSTFRLSDRNLTFDASKKMAQQAPKHIILSPFDITGKLFSQQNFRSTTIADKIDYYFQDYSLIPLMVQENYLSVQPAISRETGFEGKKLAQHVIMMMANAAESVSMGDLLDTAQRNENQWGLLPIHAVISTIRPCFFTHGAMQGMIRFSSWLGQNSKQTKTKRILRELQTKMRLKVSCDKTQFGLEYLPVLSKRLTLPLLKGVDEIEGVIRLMDEYYLNRDDWDGMIDLGYSHLLQGIESKTKSAFTRIYNKGSHPSPFSASSQAGIKKAKAVFDVPDCDDLILGDIDEEEEEDEAEENGDKDLKAVEKKVPKKRKSVGSGSKGNSKKQK